MLEVGYVTNIGTKIVLGWAGGISMSEIVCCWNGCIDENTDDYVVMTSIVIDDEDFMYCKQCNEAWEPDYEQIPHGPPHKQRMEGIARYIEENTEGVGELSSDIIYCWNGCIDKDTGWNKIMSPIVIGDEDFMFCPLCNEAWEPDYDQIPPSAPHKQRMQAIARYIEDKEKE